MSHDPDFCRGEILAAHRIVEGLQRELAEARALLARCGKMLERYSDALRTIAGASEGERYETAREYAADAIALPLDDYYDLERDVRAALARAREAGLLRDGMAPEPVTERKSPKNSGDLEG